MPHQKPFHFKKSKPAHRPASAENTSGRSDAPSDPVLDIPDLEMSKPFRFDAALVRRLIRRDVNAKEAFTARDAAGNFWRVSVKELDVAGGSAVPYERMPVSPEPVVEITLACAVLARQRMLFVAQKATELGVSRIVPLITEHSVQPGDFTHEKAHAWPGQIIRAAKQCRRSSLPELTAPLTLDAFLASPMSTEVDLSLCLDNMGGEPTPKGDTPRKVLLFIGPEGGFSESERAKLKGKTHFWILGGRVLRAETAVLVGLSAVHLAWGDFKSS